MAKKKNDEKKKGDPRVEGIATVGWVSLAALGISIPLTSLAGAYAGWLAAAIPITIILGAGVLSVRIWSPGEKQVNSKENEAMKERIKDLEERIASLEMVDSLEAHFAGKHGNSESAADLPAEPPTMGPAREESLG